ncbi:unnamed protein product [Meganyctiphanes norvegica]|uniref:Uncharacterized protein n=1 Tax=Meganyctiphanes norvegica TaxID=48144 RepID=A0AAV2RAR9_MEGNR
MALIFYPSSFQNLIEQMQASMDETDAEDLNIEIRPILENLTEVGPGENRDAAMSQLSSWLKDEKRTVEEFNYVVGQLGMHVCEYITPDRLFRIRDRYFFPSRFFACQALEAAESLVVESPVLKGPWEHLAWFAVYLRSKRLQEFVPASNSYCEWIIRMMGNSDLCPSPYLRLEFLQLFVLEVCVITNNQTQAFESVMFVCSTLTSVHMKEFIFSNHYGGCMYLRCIIEALEKLNKDEYLQAFDQQLSDKLFIQISVMIKDVSCLYGLNHNISTYIYEINVITALFETTSANAQQELNRLLDIHVNPDYEIGNIEVISDALSILIMCFKKSCQTPQLVNVTALCIIDVLEVTILFYITMMSMYPHRSHPEFDPEYLSTIDQLLGKLSGIDVNLVITNVGQNIIHKYQWRLSNLRQQLRNLNISQYSMICSLLYHCTYDI